MKYPTHSPPPSKGRSFTVKQPGELLSWMLSEVEGMARTKAKSLLRYGAIQINGRTATRHDAPLAAGDTVVILPTGAGAAAGGQAASAGGYAAPATGRAAYEPGHEPGKEAFGSKTHGLEPIQNARRERYSLPFSILYEDEHLIAIDKPSGLLTIAAASERDRTAHRILGNRALALGDPAGRVFVVHRIDRETSGVLLFAKNEAAKRGLQSRWEEVQKEYFAVVDGVPAPASDTLIHWLREDPKGLFVHIVPEGSRGLRAVTSYRVVSSRGGRALLAIRLETGRKHQIRVQLAAIGHPVCGDDRYGGAQKSAPRLALHASSITFPHPVTGNSIVVVSPLPHALTRLIGK